MIFLSVTKASMEDTLQPLEKILYIYHLFYFQKDLHETRALINSNSEVNAINLAYTVKLSLIIRKTDIRAWKIDGSIFNTFEIVLVDF